MQKTGSCAKMLFSIILSTALIFNNTGITVFAEGSGTEAVVKDFDENEEFLDSVGMSEMDMLETDILETNTFETDMPEENADIEDSQPEESRSLTESIGSVQSETESVIDSEESVEAIADEREESCETEGVNEEADSSETGLVEEGELTGVYQFGGAPSREDNALSAYSVKTASAYDAAELEEYIYQQMLERNTFIDVRSYNIAWDNRGEILSIIEAILNEHPELYCVEESYSCSGTYVDTNLILGTIGINYKYNVDAYAFKKEVQKALATVQPNMSDLEKAIVLHDYLVVNCEYDEENFNNDTIPEESYSAYGVLVNRIAVCNGYALAYKYLLNQVGIDCYMVHSSEMDHAWNLIELDEKYYQVDVTWDDPIWDRIGRVRHQYMFRSDDAFVNECRHYDWYVTEGNDVAEYKATDTRYDNAFWLSSDAPLVLVEKDCYYISDNTIKKTVLSDITESGENVCDLGWFASGLFQINNRLYFNDKLYIYSIALNDLDIDKRIEYVSAGNYNIFGSAFCQGKVLYSIQRNSAKDIVLEADIIIESSEVPVEKIELDKDALRMTIGDTAVLKASIVPDNATDADIAWESSNYSVAKVNDGTVTAIAAGVCTITVHAGGRQAVCKVAVTENEKDIIAGGVYEDITWEIDTDGKLTVTGTGDFKSEYSSAPWSANRNSIIFAEINVSGMTDASAMFYGCKNLVNVDLDGLDTGSVTNMGSMFYECNSLKTLNLSNFNTEKVTNMAYMFYECNSLKTLDLHNFNMSKVTYVTGMLPERYSVLSKIYTPYNLTCSVELFDGIWYQPDGTEITELPQNFDHSIVITKNRIPIGNEAQVEKIELNKETLKLTVGDTAILEAIVIPDNATDANIVWKSSDTSVAQVAGDGIVVARAVGNCTITATAGGKQAVCEVTVTEAERIELNKEIVQLTMGSTAVLKAVVVSDNAADVNIVWKSSDTSVAQVAGDGTITAIAVGNCTVTATAGGKQAVCDITVTEKEEGIIASGFDYDITWKINSNGKLTVTGIGDFSEPPIVDDVRNVSRAPWYGHHSDIITAEINVKEMKDASYMFWDCDKLTNIDVRGFDTSKVTNMRSMFDGCTNLTSIDASGFDTLKVTDMGSMFNRCSSLTSIDVSDFDTSNVTNMEDMFDGCTNLTSVDVSGFDTSNVVYMGRMFQNCISLTSIDVSSFDTSNVTDMWAMFYWCSGLTSIDVSGFDTQNVTNIRNMFYGCWRLDYLDLSSFDLSKVTDTDGMLGGSNYMQTIYTPYNLTQSIELPNGDWYQSDGTVITELPQNLEHSIIIKLGSIPKTSEPYIEAQKYVTLYTCGTSVNLDDLTVRYFDTDGSVKRLSESEYTTNISELDMTTAGEKSLVITYHAGMKVLTAEITLTVENGTLQLTGIKVEKESIYNGMPVCIGTAAVKKADGTDITNRVKLIYAYTGKQADDSAYQSTTTAPTNAGTYNLTVSIAENATGYTGSVTYDFEITKAPLILTARDMSIKLGAPLPSTEDYKYDIAGLMAGDRIITAPICTCSIMDTSKAGEYDILISGADAGMNYEITNKNGTLTVNEIGENVPYYAVTFDLMGKGGNISNTGVKEGSLLERPQDPQWNGYIFIGWYKNKDCTAIWDFASDTIRSDTILYAGWIEDKDDSSYLDKERTDLEAENLNCTIANIKAKVYDGNAYEPTVKVTAMVDGKKTMLTEGADYRVFYKDNISAGIGTVIVRGSGLYRGEMVKNFTIFPKPVKKLKVIAGSIAGSVSEMKVSQLPIYVYDGTKLLNVGTGYDLSDLQPARNSAQVKVTGLGNYEGSVIVKLIVYESGAQLIAPENITLYPENETEDYVYTGKAIKPDVTVKTGDITLTKKEYKVQYQNNKNAGTAYVIVTGKGAYKGKAVIPFTIRGETEESTNGGFAIKEIPSKTYNGKLQKPSVSVTIQKNGKTKKLSKKDYTVTYQNNFHSGWTWNDEAPTVIVTGKGNYAGITAVANFDIEPLEIRKASLKGTQGNLVLTYHNRKLKEGIDYKILEYGIPDKNNKVEVTIMGIGDFTDVMIKSVKAQ